MQPEIQRRCRHLDAITVKGSKLPLDIFTFDVGHLALKTPAMIQAINDFEKRTAAGGASAVPAAGAPAGANGSDSRNHSIDMPKHQAIRLQSVATVHAGEDDAAAPDIPVDDDGNPLDPASLPTRPSELSAQAEEEAAEKKRKARRGSGAGAGVLISNGAKILSSLKGMFKSEAAPAGEGPTGLPAHNKVHPGEVAASADAGSTVTPLHTGASHTPHLSIDTSSPKAASALNGHVEMSAPGRLASPPPSHAPPAAIITSPSAPKTPKPKVESGDFTPATLASLCAQLQLGLPEDFVKIFNEASSLYIKGSWAKAREVLEKKFLKQWPNDKPAKVLLGIMAETNFVKPSDWKGYRKLTAK